MNLASITQRILCLLLLTHCAPSWAIQVKGSTTGVGPGRQRPFRQEITAFSQSGPAWDLYLLALQQLQNTPASDPLSYYSIAGIHGYPNIAWDNAQGNPASRSIGYCKHFSVLFEIWHRPYLALLEQRIAEIARNIATLYSPPDRDRYSTAADTLRIPYWDWLISPSLPTVMTTPKIGVNAPEGFRSIDNPLRRYNFPVNVTSIIQPVQYVYGLDKYSSTVRHVGLDGASQDDLASQAMQADSAARLSNTYNLLVSSHTWTEIASDSINGTHNSLENLERIHGGVHNNVGEMTDQNIPRGHMALIPLSAYDPIFWLHHANMDRLTALWQALHPDSYVEPTYQTQDTFFQAADTIEDINTALAPFHADDDGIFWTAGTSRDTAVFGYTYPELVDWDLNSTALAAKVRQAVNMLYSPSVSSNTSSRRVRGGSTKIASLMSNVDAGSALELGVNNQPRQWYLRLTFIIPMAGDGDAVYLFAGMPLRLSTSWSNSRNLIGSFRPYGKSTWTSQQHVDVPCTHTVAAAIDRGILASAAIDEVVQFLKENVVVRVTRGNQKEFISLSNSGIKLSIVSQRVEPRKSLSEFPKYGEFEVHQVLA